jgi:hypothetical protein
VSESRGTTCVGSALEGYNPRASPPEFVSAFLTLI